ncbi:cyclase family protein [Rhodococcus opacus]|nr:cyclase family protein [Rhodococcus opacus]
MFSLSLPMDRSGPQTGVNGRVNPQHIMLKHGGDILAVPPEVGELRATDDAVYLPLQSSTQWDALAHMFYDGHTYNGRGPETVTSQGAQFNSITNLRDRAVGRGVLLDIPRWLGREWLDPGEAIQAEDLAECARAQGSEVGEGDFVLVRTGQITQRRSVGSWGDYAGGPAPGLGVSAADFLCQRRVAAIATDTWGVEALPYESGELRAPLHIILLINAGVYLGELWDLDALADDCAADGTYEFFLVAVPLSITGAVGSPVNPIAIK